MFGPEPPGGIVRYSQGLDQNVEPGGMKVTLVGLSVGQLLKHSWASPQWEVPDLHVIA